MHAACRALPESPEHANGFRTVLHHGSHQTGDAFGLGVTQYFQHIFGKFFFLQNAGTNRVLNVVVHVSNAVCHTNNIALFGICHPIGMAENAVADFRRQIQSLPVLLDQVYYAKALLIVPVSVGQMLLR